MKQSSPADIENGMGGDRERAQQAHITHDARSQEITEKPANTNVEIDLDSWTGSIQVPIE